MLGRYDRAMRARQVQGGQTLLARAIAAIRRNNGTLFYVPTNFAGAWTDSAGTDPVNEVADVIGRMTDRTGGSAVATQTTTANKPKVGFSTTNLLPNSTMQGASAGSPGSPPSGWQYSSAPGITRSIVGVGVVDGAAYIDVRFVGTATGATDIIFDALGSQVLPVLVGQLYTFSTKLALIAGSWPTTRGVNIAIFERSSTGSALGISSVDFRAGVPGGSLVRVSVSRTLSQATAAFVSVGLRHSAAIGDAVDFTFRMTMPQLEPDLTTSQFVPTTSGAVTQNAVAPYMMFEGANSLNVALSSTGAPFVRSYTRTGSVNGFTSATTTWFVLGQPTVAGRDVCAIVCGPTAITGADLAIIDRWAASIGAEL